eukprot:gene11706-2128_t
MDARAHEVLASVPPSPRPALYSPTAPAPRMPDSPLTRSAVPQGLRSVHSNPAAADSELRIPLPPPRRGVGSPRPTRNCEHRTHGKAAECDALQMLVVDAV